jgi:hypothetical protein
MGTLCADSAADLFCAVTRTSSSKTDEVVDAAVTASGTMRKKVAAEFRTTFGDEGSLFFIASPLFDAHDHRTQSRCSRPQHLQKEGLVSIRKAQFLVPNAQAIT